MHELVTNPAALSVDRRIDPSQQETQLILDSCHATLVRLGDLSRYRESELKTKERNWAPAVGYYDLATVIKPSSGASHNQLAVIALADGSHMRALYHLYRALSVQVPYPRARENLETQFKKILDRKNKNQLVPQAPDHQPGVVLQAWFVYLHARLHAGVSFPEHEEVESEVLTHLSVELKERPLEGLLNKFALSNIAAQHLAASRAPGRNARKLEDQF
jgi:Est1 DNA/RNA binding domain/Telomerase activating protein Est1